MVHATPRALGRAGVNRGVAREGGPGGDLRPRSSAGACPPDLAHQQQRGGSAAPPRGALRLSAVGAAAAVAGVLVEFQFYLAVASGDRTGPDNARFFANVYVLLNVAALVVQILVAPRLQRKLGVQGSLLVLPGALLGGALGALLAPAGAARSLLRVAEGGVKSSIHRVAWEPAYLPLDQARRAVTKVVAEGLAVRLAEGAAALLLLTWLHFAAEETVQLSGHDSTWVVWLLVLVTAAWLALTRSLAPRLAADFDAGLPLMLPLPDS